MHKIMRFPREKEELSHQHSMVLVWHTLFTIAAGKEVEEGCMTLASRWFGVPKVTKDMAKQLTRKGSDLRLRFPRRHRHG